MSRKKWISIAIKNSIRIPFDKPSVQKILRIKATPNVSRTSTVSGKVIYWGSLAIDVEYAAQTTSGPIHATVAEIPITGFLACKRAKPGMVATLTGEVEFMSCELTTPRLISVFILVRFCVDQLIRYPVGAALSGLIDSSHASTENNGGEVFAGRFRRPTRINAWTRKQRY